jgi:hypothetical protein
MHEGIRKIVTLREATHVEGTKDVEPIAVLVAAGAVIENPLAGRYADDLDPLIEAYCESLGKLLTGAALDLLTGSAEGMGKGALVGLAGETEHGSAIIHNLRFGNLVREAVKGSALIPSAEKRAASGATLDVPIKHIDDHKVRSHHQTLEVRIPDAPRDDEIVIWVAFANGGRPHARLASFGSELADH